MKVGLVTQWFPPETGSAALPLTFARAMRSMGHDVVVLTGIPNYPTGRVYPGYRVRRHQVEAIDEVTVHRVPLIPTHDSRAAKRVVNYMSFATSAAIGASTLLADADVLWVHGTPATVALPAMALKHVRGTPFIYHMQDLWPETVTASGLISSKRGSQLARVIRPYCDRLYRDAAHIAVSGPGMAAAVQARGVPASKTSFLPNWADEATFRPTERNPAIRASLGLDRPVLFMYAGAVGEVQGLDVVISAAGLLRDRRDIGFVIIGDGTRKTALQERVREQGLDNVVFLPPQPLEAMPGLIAAADVQVVCLSDLPLFRITLPSKLQATLASGSPVLTCAGGDAADVTRAAGAGLVATPGDAASFAQAAVTMAGHGAEARRDWGVSARAYYDQLFAERRGVAAMDLLLRSMGKASA